MLLKLLGEASTGGAVTVTIGARGPLRAAVGDQRRRHRLRAARRGGRDARRRRPDPHGLPRHDGRGARRRPLRLPDPRRGLTAEPDTLERNHEPARPLRPPRREPGRRRRRDQEGLPPLARQLHPDVNPDPETQERFKEITRAYEILSRPAEARGLRPRRRPVRRDGGGFGQGAGFSFTDIMDAFFGGQPGRQARGPRPRTRRGQDALIRLEVELAEAAFGVTRELKVDTAVVCSTCHGEGAAPGTHPQTCETCRGAGEVAHVQRSFLGEIRTLRPCAACRGFGTIIPDPCRECSGDGRVRVAPHAHRQDPGRRRHRHPRPARRARARSGPAAARPATSTSRSTSRSTTSSPAHGNDLHCTVTVPMTAAALGTTLELPTLEADVRRPRARRPTSRPASSSTSAPAPSPAASRCCAGAASPGCAAAAATWS